MRSSLLAFALVGLSLLPRTVFAQDPGEARFETIPESPPADLAPPGHGAVHDPLEEYLNRNMELRFEQGMFSPFEVYRNGAPIELGFFGGNYETVFDGSPDAIDSMSSYQLLRAIGFPLWLAGTIMLTVELAIVMVDAFEDTNILVDPSGPKAAFYGLLIGGAVTGIAGGTMMQAAPSYLSDAVLYYNRDLIRELRGQRAELPRPTSFSLTMSF